ncbi:hypothetical protein PMAA_063680 [Talaromyces marneffei ATCC 18224]|uniref:EthD domain-containing protein n=1 Tax=Talaromyces marneffei (strain ATCC 18224 / CBS 334.59 / QM 7333) TaxID=441960 RepID=B6QAC4_TALMQ|nr:hypothetical protein PMAA_063680 [Talaromyces marneffei ATCC 18224]
MAKGILYILVSPGQEVSTEQVHTWFTTTKSSIPGLLATSTYSAIDDQKPEHLAVERVFRTLALQPGPDLPAQDYNDWYEQEHIPLLSEVPGWLKSTRWVLKQATSSKHSNELGGKGLSNFLSVHEWESMASFKTEEFKRATNTPWRDRIIPKLDKSLEERRNFGKGRRI